ncbi:MAG: hypothetical protein Q4G70_12110 [Pseudomonadota bacterium]|nr:hypothetical protein [Pseudomonadota bacterium]
MNTDFHGFDHVHRLGERAMHPIAPRWACHAALLVLAGYNCSSREGTPNGHNRAVTPALFVS